MMTKLGTSCILLFLLCVNWSASLSPELEALCDAYWQWRTSDMPEFATFVGIHDYDAFLDDMSEAAYLNRSVKCQEFLQSANALEPSLTDDADIINLRVLKYELETYINFYNFKGFYLPINNLEGIQEDILRQFDWMLNATYGDFDVMIMRLEKIPLQISQIIELMRAGVANGITYNQYSTDGLNETIGRYVVVDPKDSPLYAFFSGSSFDNTTLTMEQIINIQLRAQAVLSQEVTPAFEALLNYVLNEYVTRPEIAVTTITNGVELYNGLIWFHTSTNDSVQDIHNFGFAEVDRIEALMLEIVIKMGYDNLTTQEFSNMIRDDPTNYYATSDEMLSGFEDIVYNRVPPRLPFIFNELPQTELQVVGDPSPSGSGAYYLTGAYDGSRPGVFYVNTYDPHSQPKYSMLTLSLHEGNPGHHLQGSHNIESPDFPYFRRVMEDRNYGISPSRFPIYTYFVEGWALYSEMLGFDMQLYHDDLERYGHYSEEIFRACRLVVDTGIHALGWARQEAIDYMFNHTASSLAEIENEIDRYITWPGQALAYKMGQKKLSDLRLQAEESLGSLFNLKDFHDVILNAFGPMDLVEDEVNKWITGTLPYGGLSIP